VLFFAAHYYWATLLTVVTTAVLSSGLYLEAHRILEIFFRCQNWLWAPVNLPEKEIKSGHCSYCCSV